MEGAMEKVWESGRRMSRSIGRGMGMEAWGVDEAFMAGSRGSRGGGRVDDDEEALRWAAIERLPTYNRVRTAILSSSTEAATDGAAKPSQEQFKEVDVRKLGLGERQEFIERVFRVADEDNQRFLQKLRNRIDRVGIELPTVEVRFEQLTVQAKCHVGSRALPTLLNTARNVAEGALGLCGIRLGRQATLTILKDVSGVVRPSRMTLLLGPPSSGKTTLLLALAGKLDPSLRCAGEVTYNGFALDEFVPQKTAAYISQTDVHVAEMTVKETLDFSARCQGVGTKYDLMTELTRREKEAGIRPEPEVDLFMKATSMEGVQSSLQTDYTLRILGLDICADTIVGDQMQRGISGGQKKRVTTGEMIVGPTKVLFMDEISTGLDSSTTFQIVKCLQQIVHLGEATILMSLLQPAPETFDLFDDIILLSEGQIVYQGPREFVLEFFESCGFRCPERKGTADFLQEVTSKKDQEQYWADKQRPYRYISVPEFAQRFKRFHGGLQLENHLSLPFDKSRCHQAALVFSKHSVSTTELLKASFDKEWLLIKRNSFVYIFKTIQLIIVALIASTVFLRTHMHTRNVDDGFLYVGALLFSMIVNMFNGFAELSLAITRLPVFYKHRDLLFYPAWVFTLPNVVLRIPFSIIESIVWVLVTYYTIGFAPEADRFFKHLLLVFLVQQMAGGLFRAIAGLCRSMIIAHTGGALSLLLFFVLGGFLLPKGFIPKWWIWGYWISPLMYGFNALAVNEFYAPRWMNKFVLDQNGVPKRLGVSMLEGANVFVDKNWYWIGAAGLLGFTIFFNVLFTLSLMYLNPLGRPQAVISEEIAKEAEGNGHARGTVRNGSTKSKDGGHGKEMKEMRLSARLSNSSSNGISRVMSIGCNEAAPRRGMVLPFNPLAMSFDNVNYYVDMPAEMKQQGVQDNRLQLLREVTGSFRPGVLTALMGVSGAGKTTLMDVLAGRKTGGYIEGDIRIAGYPKNQATFARISGYCEQNDIHSPQVTVRESLIYSAFLRLPEMIGDQEITDDIKTQFVDEVMELVELDNLKDALVGLPGITGLSTEQRKRLTIAVELVANPSIIFMDEPTSGLDARAAAIVMRTVRNTVDTGRTVVCTIHQPSIDIFEAFDELLLLKRGGQVIYSGQLGRNSQKMVEYFEAIPGVPKIKDKYNPATWMLEVSSISAEVRLKMDFAEYYKTSDLCKQNKVLVNQLSQPEPGTSDLYFPTQGDANTLRIVMGGMYTAVMFVGINNCSTVQPIVSIERTVFYRERAAGMYSAMPYAIAQVVMEIPYVFVQTTYYTLIVYAMMSFQWTAAKFFWFFFISYFSFLYFTFYGMMTVSISPNHEVAAIFAAAFYSLFNLFSGFFIPRPKIPGWWIWYYWICPMAWTVYGLIVTQYGDLEEFISVPGESKQKISYYVTHHFGYHRDFMPVVAPVLVLFAVFFAFMYAVCIKKLNFQQR
ncbi:ABC transporter G family member 42 [Dichanthelium oligosanthes]|uniref:ABC transporter G family member 42 n=1 Tax=Dichanthelium oligosanthes TaxID=888268 RepID=A0A1E5UTM4_9POAL|nr:ABC transporter G family member 42 [Dichanthelium oligosanthes]